MNKKHKIGLYENDELIFEQDFIDHTQEQVVLETSIEMIESIAGETFSDESKETIKDSVYNKTDFLFNINETFHILIN